MDIQLLKHIISDYNDWAESRDIDFSTSEELASKYLEQHTFKLIINQYNDYISWLNLRNNSKCQEGKLCYCGHTDKCDCSDLSFDMFIEHIENKNIILNDPNNGWKNLD